MGRLKLRRGAGGLRGAIPQDPFERCEIIIEKRPTDEWQALHREEIEAGVPVTPDDEDLFVGLNIYGYHVIPQRNVPPALWKQGKTLMLTLTEVPFTEFRAECIADIERQAPASTPEEHRAELGEVGDAALAAHRAAQNQGAAPTATGQQGIAWADVKLDGDEYVLRLPWWRRIFGS